MNYTLNYHYLENIKLIQTVYEFIEEDDEADEDEDETETKPINIISPIPAHTTCKIKDFVFLMGYLIIF